MGERGQKANNNNNTHRLHSNTRKYCYDCHGWGEGKSLRLPPRIARKASPLFTINNNLWPWSAKQQGASQNQAPEARGCV